MYINHACYICAYTCTCTCNKPCIYNLIIKSLFLDTVIMLTTTIYMCTCIMCTCLHVMCTCICVHVRCVYYVPVMCKTLKERYSMISKASNLIVI